MSKVRAEIEKAENGYVIKCWKEKDEDKNTNDFGYYEPEIKVATDFKEITSILEELFKE